MVLFFFFSSRRRHTRSDRDWSSDVCSSDLVGRLLNNLGGLEFLLGRPEDAVARLKEAFAIALDLGHDVDSAAAVASLAQVHLRTGDAEKAEEQARHALEILEGHDDLLEHIGSSRLVLGRALLEQDRLDEA